MNKYILINNEKDYKKFIKKLWIYKSYRFTKFYLINNFNSSKDINIIINALNIKNRRKRISFIYDSACNIIDNHTKNKNICGFKNNRCLAQRYNGCCCRCIYQSNKGCKTKNLTCKLFNCNEIKKRFDVINFNDLTILKILSKRQQIILKHDFFSSREEVLNDLFIGSITIFAFRIIYRLISKNYLWKFKKY